MGLVRALHDMASALWAGGLYLLLFVVVPVAVRMKSQEFALSVQRRLRGPVMGAMVVLAVTGILEAQARRRLLGISLSEVPAYRALLTAKIVLVFVMIVIALLRQRMLFGGSRPGGNGAAPTGNVDPARMKRAMALLVVNTVLVTAVLVLSGMMTTTGFLHTQGG